MTRDQRRQRIAERRQRVAELYPELRSSTRVASIIGCSHATVCTDLEALGIPRMDYQESLALADAEIQRAAKERRERVRVLYPELRSIRRVAAELECSHGTVVNDLAALGLAPGPRTKQRGRTVECPNCGTEKWRYECELNEGGLRGNFCTRSCWNRYRWKHGIAITSERSRDGSYHGVVTLSPYVVTGKTRQEYLRRWKLNEVRAAGRRKKGAEQGREVAEFALRVLAQKPSITRRDALDTLIVYFEGVGSAKLANGERRSTADPLYQKARKRVERRLARGYQELGQPPSLRRVLWRRELHPSNR